MADKETVERRLENADDIYKFMSEFEGVCGFRDDFEFWQNHDYMHSCAKPLWIDPSDSSCQHIIFDDNYRPHHADSIVDIRERDQNGRWISLDSVQLDKYDQSCLVQVDLLEAINNENYYINKVIHCETKYDNILQSPKV